MQNFKKLNIILKQNKLFLILGKIETGSMETFEISVTDSREILNVLIKYKSIRLKDAEFHFFSLILTP